MNRGKKKKSLLKKIIIVIIALVLLILLGTVVMFYNEIRIMSSIKKIENTPAYYIEFQNDYYFDEFLADGGASSDKEVGDYLTEKISHGFYKVDVEDKGHGCSTISAMTKDGKHLWGRNFDWQKDVPIIIKCVPEDGYASIATCAFTNLTGSAEALPDNIANQMLAIAALYVPMDGINEKGLCVADLEVNEGGMPKVDTDKTDLTITTAIRLLLNKASSVDEAIALLGQYDIHASGGISHHFSVSDAEGNAVAIEFTKDGMQIVDTNVVTNFNMTNEDISAGGTSAKERYETLMAVYEENQGVLTRDRVKEGLINTAQTTGQWMTQWSVIYEQDGQIDYYFNGDFSNPLTYFEYEKTKLPTD